MTGFRPVGKPFHRKGQPAYADCPDWFNIAHRDGGNNCELNDVKAHDDLRAPTFN